MPLERGSPRPAAVAGLFYPGRQAALQSTIDELLAGARTDAAAGQPVEAVLVPHAGYRYSGPTAAIAFNAVAHRRPQRIVLIGPAHRLAFRGISAGDFSVYECPLGKKNNDN